MPTDSAHWSFRTVIDNISFKKVDYVQLMVNGLDTTISNKVYKKILYRHHEEIVPAGSPIPAGVFVADAEDSYFCAIREESKRIYFFRNGKEELYYDFNLNVADTLPKAYWLNTTITGLDSIMLGSQYHKVYKTSLTSPVHNDIIVEGVGGIDGLLRIQMPFLCFRYGNKTFKHGSSSPCNYILPFGTPTDIDKVYRERVTVSPNPFSDQIYVDGSDISYYLNTITGRMLLSGHAAGRTAIHTSAYPAGQYILHVRDREGRTLKIELLTKQ
jgi:hypothetical protein